MSYVRVLPRDLFNEADLLKCMGRLWILLDETHGHHAVIVEEDVDSFEIVQDESGGIRVSNVTLLIGGRECRLVRPLNSRSPWPLLADEIVGDRDFDPIRVFDDDGALSPDMRTLIGAA